VKRGDFMGMSTIATNLSEDEAKQIRDEENRMCDSYTLVEIEKYDEPFKFGK
jgi:hypothetical protein